ncbi:MAG: hypothetical protein OXH66_10010 [Gemmatimonadetes bacterium]|nr:hypothetical protein [Gemmatimonadota bacterium]
MIAIEWVDSGREPQCAPDPAYPKGIDIVLARAPEKTCFTELPYPAKRCGRYVVTCGECGHRLAVTTAGRPDDPRSVRFPCGKEGPRS